MPGRSIAAVVFAAISIASSALACAGTFSLSPMQVDLGPATPTAVLQVSNPGDRAVTIQVRPYTWAQPDGDDVYGETRTFIINPPIFTVAPGEIQVVRIGQRQPFSASGQRAYRLVLAEIPEPDRTLTGEGALLVAVRMNIPMYVAPSAGTAVPEAHFDADGAGTGARLRVRNTGTGTLRLAQLSVHQDGMPVAERDVFVILPGATRYVDLVSGNLHRGQPLHVRAQSNGGPVDLVLTTAPR